MRRETGKEWMVQVLNVGPNFTKDRAHSRNMQVRTHRTRAQHRRRNCNMLRTRVQGSPDPYNIRSRAPDNTQAHTHRSSRSAAPRHMRTTLHLRLRLPLSIRQRQRDQIRRASLRRANHHRRTHHAQKRSSMRAQWLL